MKKLPMYISALILSSLLFCLAGCQAKFSSLKPALDEEGEVFVFLQPFPQEAERLRFGLTAVAAVRQDGTEVPLSLLFNKFEGPDMKRQRLVASGILPPGVYRGLSFAVAQAVLTTDEGEASLLVPEKPVVAELPFIITRKKASALFLNFVYQKSVTSGFSFSPAFSLYKPGYPVAGLLGYVSNSRANTITVFDKKAGQVVSVRATGREPRGVVFDQERNRAFVALAGEDSVEVIDMINENSLATIRLHTGAAPRDLALMPGGRLLMTVNPGTRTVSFIDPLSYLELSSTAVGYDPSTILLDPVSRNRAYVFNTSSNSISIIDVPARKTAFTVPVETGPVRGQFNKNSGKLYVIYEATPHLTVIDPASLRITDRVFIGAPAEALKIDTMTDTVYFTGTGRSTVEMFEPFTLFATDFIPAEGGVSYLTIDGQENSLLLLSPELRTIMCVNLNTRNVVSVFDVGEDPYQVTLMGER